MPWASRVDSIAGPRAGLSRWKVVDEGFETHGISLLHTSMNAFFVFLSLIFTLVEEELIFK